MKKSTFRSLTLLLTLVVFATSAFANAPNLVGQPDTADRPIHSGRVLVKFQASIMNALEIADASKGATALVGIASLDEIATQEQVQSISPLAGVSARTDRNPAIGMSRWRILELPVGADVVAIAARYAKDPNVEFAEPEFLSYTSAIPNDTKYALQWGHNNTGQMKNYCWGCGGHPAGVPVGTVGFDAKAQTAWDSSQGYGDANVVIAIIDSGVDMTHPDLRIWTNPGEVLNGVDDDFNGLIDDINGWDYADGDNNPNDNTPSLANGYGPGHGTACAGVAAARANNALGVAGVAGGCSVMPLKSISDFTTTGGLPSSAWIASIYYAANNGATVISMSFGGSSYNQAAQDAANYAYGLDVVLLAATGNSNSSSISYPSAYTNVIAVGAASPCGDRKRSSSNGAEVNPGVVTDPNSYTCDGERWWGSSYGVNTQDAVNAVDVIAPTILPTTDIQGALAYDPGDYSDWFNGTSCATPYAAGVVALLRSAYPAWTNAQVRAQLVATATDVVNVEAGAGWDRYSGYGLVNAGAALAQPDFVAFEEAGWFDPVVPREVATSTFGSVPVPATLTGDGTSYLNGAFRNFGNATSMAGMQWWTRIDGVNRIAFSAAATGIGGGFHFLNAGQSVTGGRHAVTVLLDDPNDFPEPDETNNNFGRQYVWTPVDMTPNTLASRAAPPVFTADNLVVIASGNVAESLNDAVGMPADFGAGYWRAVATHAASLADNYDPYLMNPSTDVFTGLDSGSWTGIWSAGGPGATDFVLVNDNTVGTAHEVAVYNLGGTGSYFVETRYSGTPYFVDNGATESVPLANDEMLIVREIRSPDAAATFRVSVEVTGATQPVTLNVYDPTFTIGNNAAALAQVPTDPSGFAFIDVASTSAEWYGLTVVRHPLEGTGPIEVTLRVRPAVQMTIDLPVPGEKSVYSVPDGSGTPINQAWLWSGTPGDLAVPADGSFTVNVLSSPGGLPLVGIPASEIYLTGASFITCPDGATADGPTDGTGTTLFSQALSAGGSFFTEVSMDYVPSVSAIFTGTGSLLSNSSDINGDLDVNLIDVGEFANDFGGAYNYRSDFVWDGTLNLVDVGQLANAVGAACLSKSAVATSDAVVLDDMGLYFDQAGTQRVTSLEPGRTVSAYVVLKGPATAEGILGWEGSLETSDNVRVLEWLLPDASLDVGSGGDHVVGTGGVVRGENGQSLVLASVRLQVTNAAPAQLYLRPAQLLSAGVESPSIAIAGDATTTTRLRGVRVDGADVQMPTAEINSQGGAPSGTYVFRGVNLANYPNPFNPMTEIRFDLPRSGVANVRIYDVAGRLVSVLGGQTLSTGTHMLVWNGTDNRGEQVVSGTYHYQLEMGGETLDKGRMVLLK